MGHGGNNVIPNVHFRKVNGCQSGRNNRVFMRTWLNQAGRKKRRANTRKEKAAKIFPRPSAGLLRPLVHPPTQRYNMKVRLGKGFTLDELKEAKIPRKFAKTIGIAVDHRRRNRCTESLQANVDHIASRKVNPLVERCLLEAAEAKKDTFYVEAPGNDKRAFTSRIGDEDLLILSKVFYVASPFLCRLDLSYNLIGDDGAKYLASLMGPRAEALSSLQLRSNAIGPEGCQALCEVLRSTPLKRFDISMNPLGKEGGLMLVSLVQRSPNLLELFMGDTEADIDVLVSLAAVLRRHPSQLAVLDVQNPRISTLQEDHTVHLGKMMRSNTKITELYLGKQRMRDEGARQLVDFLLENKVLRVLDLRCNELGAVSAYCLGTLLAHGSQLVSLNLSCNRIGEKNNVDGAKALAEGLVHNSHLEHLDLNHNELCGQALSLLGESLQHSTKLVSLRLFHNHWDQPSSYLFHTLLTGRSKGVPLKADFRTSEVDQQIHISKLEVDR